MNKSLKAIADHYGEDAQVIQCVEELNELGCVMLQNRKCKHNEKLGDVVREIADVENMLEQIKYLYGIQDVLIEQIKQEKIERQMARIEREVTNE